MPNHVHLILVPSHEDGLRATLGDAHRRYTRFINTRNKWTGHLWQGRFGSVAMDEDHLAEQDDKLVSVTPVLERYSNFADVLKSEEDEDQRERIRKAETIGHPIGSPAWLEDIESRLGRTVQVAKRGPQAKVQN